MKIPVSYIFRNLWTRKLTTLLTAGGMGLVVFVFAAVLMLDAGLKKTLVSTGSYDNAILLRQSAQTEIQSSVTRDQASLIETIPEVWRGGNRRRDAVSPGRRGAHADPAQGQRQARQRRVCAAAAGRLRAAPAGQARRRPDVPRRISEIIVGSSIAAGFEGVEIGQQQRFAGREWTVVGVFEAGKSGFDSEVWGDVEQMMQAFRRTTYSSVIARLQDRGDFAAFKGRVAADQRLTLDVSRSRSSTRSSRASSRPSSASSASRCR